MDRLRTLLATSRGRVWAAVWGVVILALIAVFLLILTPGTGTTAPIVAVHHHPTKTTPTTTNAAGTPAIASGIPAALAAQLIDHQVAIVEIYTPGANADPVIDDREAFAEAVAGARMAGAGFAGVDVTNDTEMQLVTSIKTVNVTSDPFLFILDRKGTILFQRAGYLDAATIAQAAVDALAGAQAADQVPAGTSDGMQGPYDGYWKAKADSVLCTAADQLALLPGKTSDLGAALAQAKAMSAIYGNALSGLRSIRALGPDAPDYGSMVTAWGRVASDFSAAVAALQHKPPAYSAFDKANVQATNDQNAVTALKTKLRITCFTTVKK